MKSSDFRKNYQDILDTLPLPWKYLQKSPGKQTDGYDSDSSVHEMQNSAISNVTARRVRVRRGSRNSSDSVPTAHVQPTTASRNAPLRATQKFGWEEPKRAVSPDIFQGGVAKTEDIHNKISAMDNMKHRRWGSLNNLHLDTFQEIPVDMDPTIIDENKFIKDVNDPAAHLLDKEYRSSNPDLLSRRYIPQTRTQDVPVNRPASVPPDMPYNMANQGLFGNRDRNSTPMIHTGMDNVTSPYLQTYLNIPHQTNGAYSSNQQSSMPAHVYMEHSLPSGNIGVSSNNDPLPYRELFGSDITQWQQRHQEQIRRQQLETSQPTFAVPHRTGNAFTARDPHKLDAVMKATDNIVKEKDAIIDKLKLRIIELEQQCKNLDSALQSAIMKSKEDFLMKGTQHMGNLTEKSLSLNTELEKKLGEREYEIQKLKDNFRKELQQKNQKILEMQEKYETKDGEMLEWRHKYTEVNASYETVQKELYNMNRYLADLPTADEASKKNNELKSLKDDKARYKSKLHELDKKLSEASRLIRSKEALIESMEQNEKDIESRFQATQGENERLVEQIRLMKSREGAITGEDIDELKNEIERLRQDLHKAKKLIDGKHRKMQQLEAKHTSNTEQLQERLKQEEAAVTGLRQDITSKDTQLKKLRAAHKMLGNEKQDIMEKLMICEERLKEFERQNSGKIAKLQRRLLMEMGVCFSELQSLVEVCIQRSEGQDPNISALISVKGNSLGDSSDTAWTAQDEGSLEHRVSKVKGLRLEIDKIKEKVATKYAEEMGDNLNCTQQ